MTLDRVILALGYRGKRSISNLNYDSLYVCFSRVKSKEDIRILIPKGADWSCLNYIHTLKPEPSVDAYFEGYDKEGLTGTWIKNVALDAYRVATAPEPWRRCKRRTKGSKHKTKHSNNS